MFLNSFKEYRAFICVYICSCCVLLLLTDWCFVSLATVYIKTAPLDALNLVSEGLSFFGLKVILQILTATVEVEESC